MSQIHKKQIDRMNFFTHLYKYCEGKIETRQLPSKKREFHEASDIRGRDFTEGENIYFAVATRDGNGGGKANIVEFPSLWCDDDYKDNPKTDAEIILQKCPCQPSAVIESGGGKHLYWFLKEPADKDEIPQIESLNRRLAKYLRGDSNSCDAAHILRIPGTLNHKYDPPRPVELIELQPDLRYDLADFDDWLPEDPKKNGNKESCPKTGTPSIGPDKDWRKDALQGVDDGQRNTTATQLAGSYVRKGLYDSEILSLLSDWNRKNNPPLDQKELTTVIQSVGKTHDRNTPSDMAGLTQRIRDFVDSIEGRFTTRELHDELGLNTPEQKHYCRTVLTRLTKEKLIERLTRQIGTYRKVSTELNKMDLVNMCTETVDLRLPLSIDQFVNFHPGNIILIAGDANAGKTGFLLNVAKDNMEDFNIHYFSSEMGPDEMRMRIDLFDDFPLGHKNFNSYERHQDFADVIQPGQGNLNIIDYLELTEDFFLIGKYLKDIHQRLEGALAVVAVQKRHPTGDDPLGGKRGLEKPRLVLSMRSGSIKITKAKNWATNRNPNYLKVDFKLAKGCKFIRDSDWGYDADDAK